MKRTHPWYRRECRQVSEPTRTQLARNGHGCAWRRCEMHEPTRTRRARDGHGCAWRRREMHEPTRTQRARNGHGCAWRRREMHEPTRTRQARRCRYECGWHDGCQVHEPTRTRQRREARQCGRVNHPRQGKHNGAGIMLVGCTWDSGGARNATAGWVAGEVGRE